jgi:DNA polymerase III delta prime subunit
MNSKLYIPWVEKYRPTNFENIVLDNTNQVIFDKIFKTNYIPNILLYGPPGTGKTTTIINLINKYQQNNNQVNKGLMIHLNASDDRGIDIIRNQINSFVNSKTLFVDGVKFVILDEVDYMTKNAQLALKYLLQDYRENIRFCLICNYISKIDSSLQNSFVKLRFNQLPAEKIVDFLSIININENLQLSGEQIKDIQCNYKSDIRSMINYMQSNQHIILNMKVINNNIFDEMTKLIKKKNVKMFSNYIYDISDSYNIDNKTIIKDYCTYLIRSNIVKLTRNFLKIIEEIVHNLETNCKNQIYYLFYSLETVLKL